MARLQTLAEESMSPAQKAACAAVIAGPRGKVPTPMGAWLRNPELATTTQELGALLRFKTSLDAQLTELAILVCARHWTAHLEWTAHKKLALAAGLPDEVIAAIARREPPTFNTSRHRAVYLVAQELMATGRLSQATYDVGHTALSETGMVELVALLGYYSLVALTLNAFELGMPEMRAPELDEAAPTTSESRASI